MSTRSWLAPLVAVLAVAVAAPAESRAAEPAEGARAKGKRLVVSPRPGQVVHWHHVRVRVRSRTLTDTLRVRLNGTQVGADFGRPRRGARTLRASLSHGLRRGRNVLRVTVRSRSGVVRTARVRFTVRTKRHLVGAGRDRLLAVGGKVRIRGAVAPRGARTGLRWRVVRAPRRSRAHTALLAGKPTHTLSSPRGRTAGFRPRLPGTYTLRLGAGNGSRAASDLMTLDVAPRSKLVPIDTMTATDTANGDQRGIRVGNTTYLLRDAAFSTPSGSVLQVLVLKRRTLGFVSNRKYLDGSALAEDLRRLDSSNLVILVLQPGGLPGFQYGELDKAVGRIGVPDMGASLPKNTGLMSAIGVPGMDPGDADVNILTGSTGPIAPMKGYLTPDQYGEFGFVPSERKPFTFAPQPKDPCAQGDLDCLNHAGFRVRNLDPRTLAPGPKDGEFYATGTYRCQSGIPISQCSNLEALRMAEDLEAIANENVVTIEAVSARSASGGYSAPIANGVHPDNMVRLANAIAGLGGTRNGFNRIARKEGAIAGGGLTYALVGWKGAGEGAGAEVAAGVDGADETPTLSGVLRPDRQSRFRPVVGDASPDALASLVMREPTTKWPLDDDRGARTALSCLGSTHSKLGPDPRGAYALQPFEQAQWNAIAEEIDARTYAGARSSCTRGQLAPVFTEAQFRAARDQLVQELKWVGNVRAYLANLAKPVSGSEVLTYARVIAIGAKVHEEAKPPDDDATMRWLEFAEILLELAGPITHEVSSTVAGAMELGVWMFGADEKGGPVDEIPFKADELGDKIVAQMRETVDMYSRMGNVIVTDPSKLAFVGENGGCIPQADGCPEGWSFTNDDITALKSDLERTVERTAYEQLLPLGFLTYGLNPERLDRAPDPRWYNCGVYPWWYYSDTALALGTTPLLLEVNPAQPRGNLWKLLVLSRPRGNGFRGSAPSDETLKRVFGPVANSTEAGEGGLGVPLSRLVPADDWQLWSPTPPYRPTHDDCS